MNKKTSFIFFYCEGEGKIKKKIKIKGELSIHGCVSGIRCTFVGSECVRYYLRVPQRPAVKLDAALILGRCLPVCNKIFTVVNIGSSGEKKKKHQHPNPST